MHGGAAELLGRDGFIGHGLHHVRAGDEHIAGVAHHEDEIRHGGRIDVAAGAGPHDDGNLRNDAGGQHIALEHLAIAPERRDALLNARAAGVEDADDRRAVLERHVLELGDLLRVRVRERAAEHGEILGEDENGAAVDRAPAGDHAVAGDFLALVHAEIGAAMFDEHIELLERSMIEQEFDAFARRELAARMLSLDALVAAAQPRRRAPPFEAFDNMLHFRLPWMTE